MAEIALYYPYVHPRDESWVKQALLFWPKIQRIVPENYPITDSPLLKRLVDEKILIERRPEPGADQLSGPFVEYVARFGASLRANYGVQRALKLPPQPGWNDSQLDPRLGWIHSGKVDPGAVKALLKSKLATLHRGEPTWIGVHPALFHVYMCFLAAQLSQRTSTMTEPVTDAPLHHVGAFGWSIEDIARALLTELPHPKIAQSRRDDQPDPQALLVAVAVRALEHPRTVTPPRDDNAIAAAAGREYRERRSTDPAVSPQLVLAAMSAVGQELSGANRAASPSDRSAREPDHGHAAHARVDEENAAA